MLSAQSTLGGKEIHFVSGKTGSESGMRLVVGKLVLLPCPGLAEIRLYQHLPGQVGPERAKEPLSPGGHSHSERWSDATDAFIAQEA